MEVLRSKISSYNQLCKNLLSSRLSAISSYFLLNNVNPAVQEAALPETRYAQPISKSNFELSKIVIEPGHITAANDVRSFLNAHYFKRQPTIALLAQTPSSCYLNSLVEKYSTTGDQWLAYQIDPNMRTRRLVGVAVAYKKFPWEAAELERIAHFTAGFERYHMYFNAYCARSADVFTKYRIPYVYDIELVATAGVAEGRLEELLLRTVTRHATHDSSHPLVQVLASTEALRDACATVGMTAEWSTMLENWADGKKKRIFASKTNVMDSSSNVELYVRLFRPSYDNSRSGIYSFY